MRRLSRRGLRRRAALLQRVQHTLLKQSGHTVLSEAVGWRFDALRGATRGVATDTTQYRSIIPLKRSNQRRSRPLVRIDRQTP